ncbi:conjugal transfer protein TraD [Erythrobacter sp.]|uniref:conjugal transfer protein TraD n=1 Tax=Erythrobacter sp. TaxID=1042 RepID=UPI001B0B452D|nr:conjugal transfer protein TraD [Erythrobacter sp.]MBO6525638.1 conjugal transfer protein TraD [Erythrobacter sp.]MBO6529689.1 conjugal transfer protein TraD [Erythrobacter sp.]
MRKPRDFDAELKALNEKAAALKTRKVQQFGELVIATGADTLSIEELTGALVTIAATNEPQKREAWATKGQAFFRGNTRKPGKRTQGDAQSGAKGPDSDPAR